MKLNIQRRMKKVKIFYAVLILIILAFLASLMADEVSDVFIVPKIINAKSSSTLVEKGRPQSQYSAAKAFDNDLKTSWCEGRPDAGIGETIEINFPPTAAAGITIMNGFAKDRTLYYKNNRVKDYMLTITYLSGEEKTFKEKFKDDLCGFEGGSKFDKCEDMALASCSEGENSKCYKEIVKGCWNKCLMDTYDGGGGDFLFKEGNSWGVLTCIKGIKLKILSVYPGKNYNDTCIAEIRLKQPIARSADDPIIKKLETMCSGK